jgi:acyl carrier protein
MNTLYHLSHEQALDRIAEIVRRISAYPPGTQLCGNTCVTDMDSMVTLDFLLSVEAEFGIELNADDIISSGAYNTLGSLVEYLFERYS